MLYACTDEPNYWWFELAILLNKTMMCGGLVVLDPGSPTQVVCGMMIMLFHLLLVLKLAPYIHYSEDWSSFASSLGLTLTYVGALIKMLQVEILKRGGSVEYANKLNYADIAMDTIPVACVSVVVLIMIFVDCGLWNCLRGKKNSKGVQKNDRSSGSLTQVQPIQPVDGQMDAAEKGKKNNLQINNKTKRQRTVLETEEDHALKNWGGVAHSSSTAAVPQRSVVITCTSRKQLGEIKKKYGPHSVEYKTALQQMGKKRKTTLNGQKK